MEEKYGNGAKFITLAIDSELKESPMVIKLVLCQSLEL